MSLFFRGAQEHRQVGLDTFFDALGSKKTSSGVKVTPSSAMTVGAMWSAVHLLSSTVATLPVDVFRGSGASRQQVVPQPKLVASPSLLVSRRDWVYQAMVSLLLRGNAYGLIVERDNLLRPRTVEWLDPDSVEVSQKSQVSRPTYEVGGEPEDAANIVHMRAFVRPGSARGMSPVENHAETLGISLAAQRFGADWFSGGAQPTALFQNEERALSPEEASRAKEKLMAILGRKREPLALGKDWKYTQVSVAANESQFLESMGYTDAQVARIFGPGVAEVLGYSTPGGSSSLTYTNRVDRSLDLLTYSVMQWVVKFEDMWTENIAQPQTVKLNTSALLRADNKTRWDVYRIMREIGAANIDEIRALEDESPLPGDQGQDYAPLKASGGNTVSEGQPNGNE